VKLGLADFEDLGRCTPLLANIRPSGAYLMEDFFYAGGLPALLRNLGDLIDTSALTANGRTLGENIERAKVFNDDVIRTRGNTSSTRTHWPCCSGTWPLRGPCSNIIPPNPGCTSIPA